MVGDESSIYVIDLEDFPVEQEMEVEESDSDDRDPV